ncbi:MAG: glycosyltransferase family 4 protein [Candidatus Competibacteraceae bacterium]|nr:MAG: glycosyltransferase family 4 protein [Candidatus Competibacteraceae bacterium]
MWIASGILAFGIAFGLSRWLANSARAFRLLDHPNARSLHQRPIPRTGGLAVLGGLLAGGFLIGVDLPAVRASLAILLLGLVPLALVSFLDDRQGIAARWRLLVHVGAAGSLAATGFVPDALELPGLPVILPDGIALLLALLFVVWMINLYNFMDGMDGFAGGMTAIGFAALGWLGRTDPGFAAFCLTVAAASAGFLVGNFPPARIFLGDTGSTALGFLAAACGLWGARAGLFPFWVALLVFSPFIVDATVTLLRRLLAGERIWEAHRSHYYQRLVLLGWGHRRTVLAEYALMLACAGSALLAVRLPSAGQVVLAGIWVGIYGLFLVGVEWLERRRATVSAP